MTLITISGFYIIDVYAFSFFLHVCCLQFFCVEIFINWWLSHLRNHLAADFVVLQHMLVCAREDSLNRSLKILSVC